MEKYIYSPFYLMAALLLGEFDVWDVFVAQKTGMHNFWELSSTFSLKEISDIYMSMQL